MLFALISAVSMLIVLGVLVLVHEFGHFAVAKFFGVRVETFSIGFGTRLFGFRRGDTDYRISLVPLGGYVKMAGELGGDGTIPVSGATHRKQHHAIRAISTLRIFLPSGTPTRQPLRPAIPAT